MRRLPTRTRSLLAALLLVLPMLVVTSVVAPSAQAAPCYHSTCNGKDPDKTGCAKDGRTIDEITSGSFRVELRLSSTCGAAWARISSPNGTPAWYCNTVFGQIRSYTSDDRHKAIKGKQANCPGSDWTAMLSFGDFVRACVSYVWIDSYATPFQCTARH